MSLAIFSDGLQGFALRQFAVSGNEILPEPPSDE
jgi:hypothetical protein